ncbi:MAG: peptide deformylase [Patescibacteria group bacterium]
MKKILQQKEELVLRKIAKEIPIENIKKTEIKKIIKEMSLALATQHDGVAIAAPQIGYSLRIFLVSGKIFEKDFVSDRKERLSKKIIKEEAVVIENKKTKVKDLVFINPKISRLSRDKEWLPEGCLSVRWLYGNAYRSKKATVSAYDEEGNKFTRGASGLLAQIFQHETDHLNGVLFIDHAKDIREELPQ